MAFVPVRALRSLVLVLGLGLVCSSGADLVAPKEAHACGTETYSSRGVVKSFGPEHRYVNIAHEKIEGYMGAMTMSFEPRSADQLAALREGDLVTFSFTVTEEGKRYLNAIRKDAPKPPSPASLVRPDRSR